MATVIEFRRAASFADFWQGYPRKVAKKAARKSWERALKDATPDEIMAGLENFLRHLPSETQFIPHPTTWLNQGRWEDEYDTAINSGPKLDFTKV